MRSMGLCMHCVYNNIYCFYRTILSCLEAEKMLNQFYNANPQNSTSSRNSSDIKLNYFDTNKSFVRGFTSVILEDQVSSHRWLRTLRLPTTELSETTSVTWGWGVSRFCCGFLLSLCSLVSLVLLLVSLSHWLLPRQFHQHQDQQHPNHQQVQEVQRLQNNQQQPQQHQSPLQQQRQQPVQFKQQQFLFQLQLQIPLHLLLQNLLQPLLLQHLHTDHYLITQVKST